MIRQRYAAWLVAFSAFFLSCQSDAQVVSCSIENMVIGALVKVARDSPPSKWQIANKVEKLTLTIPEGGVLRGWSFTPATGDIVEPREFVLLLQGNAMRPDHLFETADKLVSSTGRRVLVYEYRGYASDSKYEASMNSLMVDTQFLLQSLLNPNSYQRGVVIGMSVGGVAGLRAINVSNDSSTRILLDSTPVSFPWYYGCPKSIEVKVLAVEKLLPRLGIIFGDADSWGADTDAKMLMDRVRTASGYAWKVKGQHMDLSTGLSERINLYKSFIEQKK